MNTTEVVQRVSELNNIRFKELKTKAENWRAENGGKLKPWQAETLRKALEYNTLTEHLIEALMSSDKKRYVAETENKRLLTFNNAVIDFFNLVGVKVKQFGQMYRFVGKDNLETLLKTPCEYTKQPEPINQLIFKTLLTLRDDN